MSSFSIKSPRQILSHLSLLFQHKCLLSARFGADNEFYLTTALLCINIKNNTMVLDCGSKEDLNQRIINADKVVFDTEFRGIKVSFTGAALTRINHNGEPAFCMPIPDLLFWLERRECYRVKVPQSNPGFCRLILEHRQTVNLQLHDISLSGFSMLNDVKEVSRLLLAGGSFSECKLILPEAGECMISFIVGNKLVVSPDNSRRIQKIGCKFINITATVEETIQRYMHHIQRENLRLESTRRLADKVF